MTKAKLLIASENLAQGGNERWIYEICRALDKEKFEVGILCSRKYLYTAPEQDFSNYYYHEIKKLGVPVYEYLDGYIGMPRWKRGVNKIKRKIYGLYHRRAINFNPQIISLVEHYDVICVMDHYNYGRLKDALHQWREDRFFIVLHSEKFQYTVDPYACFDKDRHYKFAYFMPKQIREIEESGLDADKTDFFYAPLVLDLSDYPNVYNPIDGEQIVIAIFSRIALARPLDRLIKAFAEVKNQSKRECLLNIYGQIIDQEQYEHLQDLIAELNIDENSVRFMGHAQNIAETVKRDNVNIYWGTSSGGILGYGSIETVAMGIPTIFFDYDESVALTDKLKAAESLMMYNRFDDFIAANLKYIPNNDLLAELSKKQRDYIVEKHHIANNIKDFENYVASLK
jgi:glycosyltransferase involved in cell wall biosynthesis